MVNPDEEAIKLNKIQGSSKIQKNERLPNSLETDRRVKPKLILWAQNRFQSLATSDNENLLSADEGSGKALQESDKTFRPETSPLLTESSSEYSPTLTIN